MRVPPQLNRTHLLTAALLVGAAGPAAAQDWVEFNEETATRLQLTTVPLSDPEETDFEVGDFDLDGDDDVLIMRKTPVTTNGPRTDVLLMNENGVLVDRTLTLCPDFVNATDTRDAWAFDYDNDGWMDFVTATTISGVPKLYRNLGNGGGGAWQGFQVQPNWLTNPFPITPRFCAVSAGDIDNDGDEDLYFSNYQQSGQLGDRLCVNNGDGTFTDVTDTKIGNGLNDLSFGTGNFIYDINQDGFNDVIHSGGLGDDHGILINDGTGGYFQRQVLPTIAAYQLNVNDFDNDNDLDIYVCDDGQDYVFYNDGVGSNGEIMIHTAPVDGFLTTGFNHHNHAVDIDNDGWLDIGMADVDVDIFFGCAGQGQFTILRNRAHQGGEGFYDAIQPNGSRAWNTQGTFDFAWIDLNQDGFMDMIQGSCSAGYRVFVQDPPFTAPGTAFCFGNGGVSAGCTDCPCGNDAPSGVESGCLNSTGQGAVLSAVGTASVSNDTLRFGLEGGNPLTFAILSSANNQLPNVGPCPPGSGIFSTTVDGLRCVGGGLLRHGTRPMAADGSVGNTTNPWGPPAGPPGGILAQGGFSAGQTRNFQVFYREEATAVCGTGQNTSNAYSVTMQP